MPFPLLGVLGIVSEVISKVIPDPQAAAQAKIRMIELAQAGDMKELEANLQIALAQTEVNKAEALTGNWFRAGWRPATGWVCALAFAYSYLLLPIGTFLVHTFGTADMVINLAKMPSLDLQTMMPVLLGMLGLGGMRSFERSKGKA